MTRYALVWIREWFLRGYYRKCSAKGCPYRMCGVGVWCREHTDRILAGEGIEGWQ